MFPLAQQQNIYDKFEALNRVGSEKPSGGGYESVTEFVLLVMLVLLMLALVYTFLTRLGQRRPLRSQRGPEAGGPFEAWNGQLVEGASLHLFWDQDGQRRQTTGAVVSSDSVGVKLQLGAEVAVRGAIAAVKTGDTFVFHGVLLDGTDEDGLVEARPGRNVPVRLSGRSARLPVAFKAVCALAGREDVLLARVTNMSLGGVGLLIEEEVPGGTPMTLRMLVPDHEREVVLEGRLEWCRPDIAGLYRIGFTMSPASDETLAWLADVMLRAFMTKAGGLS